jgi:hypothetical protein
MRRRHSVVARIERINAKDKERTLNFSKGILPLRAIKVIKMKTKGRKA